MCYIAISIQGAGSTEEINDISFEEENSPSSSDLAAAAAASRDSLEARTEEARYLTYIPVLCCSHVLLG